MRTYNIKRSGQPRYKVGAFLVLSLWLMLPAVLAAGKAQPTNSAPTTFAPLPPNHDLASIWNDPDFTRRLIGSYGFASDAEPRMSPEEQVFYREKVVPLLANDPKKAIPVLQGAIKPSAS